MTKCALPKCNNIVTDILKSGKLSIHCSRKCRGQHNSLKTRQAVKDKCIEKYGVTHHLKVPEILLKQTNTNIEKYGVSYPMQNSDVKDKKIGTVFEKYGVTNVSKIESVKIQKEDTCMLNFGVTVPRKSKVVRDKYIDTCLKKFGVENAMQDATVHEKSQKYRWKLFTLPSGREIKVQGYEGYALADLLQIYVEREIEYQRSKIPEIWYEQDGIRHRYFADFYIKKNNLIVEVKSNWTYNRYLEKNLLKEKAVKEFGYNFQLIIKGK